MLFLIYTCLFCGLCFAVSLTWALKEVISGPSPQFLEKQLMPVNYIMLAVISGIIGVVLSGFTGWHVYLVTQGQTTIESLEKIRYLSPFRNMQQHHPLSSVRRSNSQSSSSRDGEHQSIGDQLYEIHANALPGVTRPEEGEERTSPARDALRQNYNDLERRREFDRYSAYLDERDSEKLPNAFDLGWKRNMRHVFGPVPWLWLLPICNTTGDGWHWEASAEWHEATRQVARDRGATRLEEERLMNERARRNASMVLGSGFAANGMGPPQNRMASSVPRSDISMQTLAPNDPPRRAPSQASTGEYDSSDDNDDDDPRSDASRRHLLTNGCTSSLNTENWNDLPEDMMQSGSRAPSRNRMKSRSPRPQPM